MYSYATRSQIIDQLEGSAENAITAGNLVKTMTYARRATAYIEQMTTHQFIPERVQRTYFVENNIYNYRYNTLLLAAPTVAIDSVVIGGNTITSDEYTLYPIGSRYPSIELFRYKNYGTWLADVDIDTGIAITAIECYKQRYDTDGWITSGDTVQNTGGITATDMTIEVSDADGVNGYNVSPRFDVGQLIRIGTEYMIVTATDTSLNTITVIRGQRGTSSTAHDENAIIYTFNVEQPIVRACMLIATFNLNNIGNMSRVTFDGVTTTERLEIPTEANDIIKQYIPKSPIKGF